MKLFVNLNSKINKDNDIDFSFISKEKEEKALKEHKDIDSYLSNTNTDDWREIKINKQNLATLKDLVEELESFEGDVNENI